MDEIIAKHRKGPVKSESGGDRDIVMNTEDAADFTEEFRRISTDFEADSQIVQDRQVPDRVQMVSTTYDC